MALLRILAPHFTAGVVLDEWGIVIRSPPILAWSVGKPAVDLRRYARRKGWKVHLVEGKNEHVQADAHDPRSGLGS